MYDTVNMILKKSDAPNVDFLSEVPCRLRNKSEHVYSFDGSTSISGYLDDLKVKVKENQIIIANNSTSKWYYKNNFKTLARETTKLLFEKLSDELRLPMKKADITRLDLATNIIMVHPVQVYMHHLGVLSHYHRLVEIPRKLGQ